MNAENRWWVAELLAVDCEKAWLHPEEEALQKWDSWSENGELQQQRVNQMIKSAEGSFRILHRLRSLQLGVEELRS